MARLQVTCITKLHPQSAHEHITHIGNPINKWILATPDVIRRIDQKTDSFYIIDPQTGKVSHIGVVRVVGRNPYIRTYSDGDWNNNLLSLNQCPL